MPIFLHLKLFAVVSDRCLISSRKSNSMDKINISFRRQRSIVNETFHFRAISFLQPKTNPIADLNQHI